MKKNFGLSKKEVKTLAEYGGMAPSGGNAQPWKLVFTKNSMEIKLDPVRSDSFIDVGRYASVFSLGCFLENADITAKSLGLKYKIEKFEYKDIDSTIAKLTFSGRKKKSTRHPLYKYIPKRVTNRQIHDGTILSDAVIEKLVEITEKHDLNCTLKTRSSYKAKKELAKNLGKIDGIRSTNEKALDQLVKELRWSQSEVKKTRDGIDLKTLELPGQLEKVLALLKESPKLTKVVPREAFEDQAKPVLVGCSHLCCFSLEGKLTYKKTLEAGQAMQRIWLKSTELDLAIQPWTVSTFFFIRVNNFKGKGFNKDEVDIIKEVEMSLRKLFELTKAEIPLFIFRLSRAKPPSAHSLRLHWKDYTKIREK